MWTAIAFVGGVAVGVFMNDALRAMTRAVMTTAYNWTIGWFK